MTLRIDTAEPFLPSLCPIEAAVKALSLGGIEERGAIFTRGEVVDFILDLVGYTADKPLHRYRFLEPSFGNGDFLLAAVRRLLDSWQGSLAGAVSSTRWLVNAIHAVELHVETFRRTRGRLLELLAEREIEESDRIALVDAWLHQGDFLLTELQPNFTHVVGNPPYVR